MRTNIDIDDDLLREVQEYLQTPTKRATVEAALRRMLRLRAIEELEALRGKVEFWNGYDYKALRLGD